MALLSNLYPPTMPSLIPGFIRTQACKIYFSISQYNSPVDIANVQISLTNITTNDSAFKKSLYPTGIKLTELFYDSQAQDDYCYYVKINPSDLADGNSFKVNKYYKVQLRFTSVNAATVSLQTPQAISTWLSQNMQHFSEWSRSCLIRGISTPSIHLNGLIEGRTVTLDTPLSKIVGELTFEDSEQTDYLMEYNVKFYVNSKLNLQDVAFDSGTIYPDRESNNNSIDYDVLYSLLKETSYTLCFSYKTSCLYSQQLYYYFDINQSIIPDPYNIKIETTPNDQDGYINIKMNINTGKKQQQLLDNELITIYRSSSKDDFYNYEKIYTTNRFFSENNWQDLSIESGVWYKYTVFIVNNEGKTLYTPVETDPVMCIFEDLFLTHGGLQLRLKFNPTISGFKYNVIESNQTTMGSKYPFIKRNGKSFYRTFSVSGLISSLIDESFWYDPWSEEEGERQRSYRFASKRDIYKTSAELYEDYENQHNISPYLNPLYERLFREMVYDFLYKDEAKLFKSPTEGNILVYLSDISFEPVSSLGRILYSFSATATEIDDASFEKCEKYNIMPFYTYDIVTEAPSLNIIRRQNKLVLVIDAYGATQKLDQNWILHLEQYNRKHNTVRG